MKQTMLLLKGYPGCGKSALGRGIAHISGWPLIDKDDARDALQQYYSDHKSIDWNTLSYDIMFNYAETQLKSGLSLIIDSPLARVSLFERAKSLADKYGADVKVVQVTMENQQAWARRLQERGREDLGTLRSHKPGSLDDVQRIIQRDNGSERFSNDLPASMCMTISTCQTDGTHIDPTIIAREVLEWIQRGE